MKTKRALRRIAGFLKRRLAELKIHQAKDPRANKGRRWKIHSLLTSTLLGLMTGCHSLADVEKLTQDLAPGMRHLLKITRRLADTTLRDFLCRMGVESLRAILHRTIHSAWRRKALPTVENLPFHVVALDGKSTALPCWNGPYAQRQLPEQGKPYGLLRTITATLATAQSKPCIDVNPIPSHTNEMGHFQTAFADVQEAYGDLFRMVTYDAGANSEDNASAVVRANKHYLFHMANEERHMTQIAHELLATQDVAAQTIDVVNNTTMVRRTIRIMRMRDYSHANHKSFMWPHTQTILRVDSQTLCGSAGLEVVTSQETRLYCSSLPTQELSASQWLLVVRLHWAVETTHQILDTAFQEDAHPWIVNDARGALVVLILRRVAYTLLTLFRCVTQRSEDRRAMPWKDLMGWIFRTTLLATHEVVLGLRVRYPQATIS